MQKRLLAAAIAAMMSLSAAVVLASPIELDGSAAVQYRQDKPIDQDDKVTGSKYTVILNATSNIDQNLDVYARLGTQGVTVDQPSFHDYTPDGDFEANIDQYGLLYNNGGFTYKLGRQSATIGSTALLYNNNYMVGKHTFVDGLSVNGTSGVTSLDAIAAQEDNAGDADNKLYALHASYKPSQNLTLGATLAKYDYAANAADDTNHYAVDAAYDVGKATVFGEYTRSSRDSANEAYDLGVKYSLDNKNAVGVTYQNVEMNGDMGGKTDFDNNQKAMYYSFNHRINDQSDLNLFYKADKALADKDTVSKGDDSTSFRATVSYKF